MVTMARSPESIWGPYDASPGNPLLTAANTTRLCKLSLFTCYAILTCPIVQTVGHADLFPDAADNWYGILDTRRRDL